MLQHSSTRHARAGRAPAAGRRVCPTPAHLVHRVQVPRAASKNSSLGTGSLSILTNTRPVDRLRFQALLVFKHFDTDGDGKLTLQQLREYADYSATRFGPAAAQLQPLYEELQAGAKAGAAPGSEAAAGAATEAERYVDMEDFIGLVREQVKVASASREFPRSVFSEAELGQLGWSSSLSPPELASALAIFRLLDFNGDNYVKLEDLRKAQGIEREVVADKLEDADTNEDGFLSFKDFLTSYARERPVVLNMVVLLAHTAVYWLVLNLPMLELPVKAVLCVALLLKPQFITGGVIKLYTIIRTVIDRARAEIEMASQRGRGAAA